MSDEPELKQPSPAPKPGYRTTEFWLASIAMLVGILLSSGLIKDGSQANTIAGYIVAALGTLGYSVSRGLAKKS